MTGHLTPKKLMSYVSSIVYYIINRIKKMKVLFATFSLGYLVLYIIYMILFSCKKSGYICDFKNKYFYFCSKLILPKHFVLLLP